MSTEINESITLSSHLCIAELLKLNELYIDPLLRPFPSTPSPIPFDCSGKLIPLPPMPNEQFPPCPKFGRYICVQHKFVPPVLAVYM